MTEPTDAGPRADRERRVQPGTSCDVPVKDLEELVAEALEATPEDRDALLATLEREDAEGARRVRARLEALGELGLALDAPPRAARLPSRFGSFRRHERVGGGGMGEVYLARDERSGALAAIKFVRADHLWFETARGRFRREVEATSELAHPGIVRVLEVGEERGVPWLAMEWVGGVSLEEVLERLHASPPETLGGRDFERAVRDAAAERAHAEAPPKNFGEAFPGASHVEVVARIAMRVARALAHAHEHGVLHRDVKPSNILVTPAGRVLLADFGLALPRGADRMTRTGSWLGSLPYAAPEQIEGSPRELDQRADVYSLGATFYELLTLRTPFLGGPESVVRRRITTGDLEGPRSLNRALPRELERICLAALDPDPWRRPSRAAELAEELERALTGRPVRVRRTPLWLRARRWTRRHPRLALASAAAVVVVLGSLGLALREKALATRLMRLGDAELVRGLEEDARGFWPAAGSQIAPMQAWLSRAEELLTHVPQHRLDFAELTRLSLPYGDSDRASDQAGAREDLVTLARELDGLEGLVDTGDRNAHPPPPDPARLRERDRALAAWVAERPEELAALQRERSVRLRARMERDATLWHIDIQQLDDFDRLLDRASRGLQQRITFRFADPLDAWQHDALRRLLEDLERLDASIPRVRAQLASTETLAARLAGEGVAEWAQARAAIRASPRYGGLDVAPILGLDPLGENPESGLWEFLLASSGVAPAREGGRWRMEEDSGAVLVLLPAARFWMGQRDGEGTPGTSARPVHEIELAPFFISRFELSVGQTERLGGFPAEKTPPPDGRLPLVLDWERARTLLHEHGLELPTEAQWEFAARAGTEKALPLEGHANVFDVTGFRGLRDPKARLVESAATFDDGFSGPAPIGSYLPNAFGLHDVLGNVSEWCFDVYVSRGYSSLFPRTGDGLRATVVSAQLRAVRGGCGYDGPALCQLGLRGYDVPTKMTYWTGVRPVRAVSPD